MDISAIIVKCHTEVRVIIRVSFRLSGMSLIKLI